MSQIAEGVTCYGEGSDFMTTIRSREEILTAALQSAQALRYKTFLECCPLGMAKVYVMPTTLVHLINCQGCQSQVL